MVEQTYIIQPMIDPNIAMPINSILSTPISATNPGITWGMFLVFLVVLWLLATWMERK